jgi:hypothetical protein
VEALDLHVGRPLHRGALTVFPVWNGRAVTRRGYDVTSAHLEVTERAGQPLVDQLVVTNTGVRPALVLEGELLEGGQQHRVAARSTMVAPRRTEVLKVRCVEEGRWSGGRTHRRSGSRAPLSIRSRPDQHRTWARVRALEDLHETAGSTHALGDALSDVSDAAGQLVAGLTPLTFQTGVLIGIAGRPVQLEVFDHPRTLVSAWTSLLRAAAFDSLAAREDATPGWAARDFADQIGRVTHLPADEEGRRRSPHADLAVLSWQNRVVHAVAINPRHELVSA